uniref:Uncharacterized protein n=1 Tax=Arion vulgaris TaxID=1028688 RepID=A0A0B6ZRV9_9EUPU
MYYVIVHHHHIFNNLPAWLAHSHMVATHTLLSSLYIHLLHDHTTIDEVMIQSSWGLGLNVEEVGMRGWMENIFDQ